MSRSKRHVEGGISPWTWVVLAVVLAMLAMPSWWGSLRVYRAAKTWRAHNLAAESTVLMEQHDLTAAQPKVEAAHTLAPFDPQVLRACAQLEAQAGDPRAVGYYRQLLKTGSGTRDDEREALRVCLMFGDLKGAGELAAQLTAKEPTAEDYALQAQVLWQQRSVDEAIATMRKSVEMDPRDHTHELLLAQMLVLSGSSKNQVEAMGRLKSLGQNQDAPGLQALLTLAKDRSLDEATRRSTLAALQKHPLLNDDGRMAAWELEARLRVRDLKVILQEAVDYFKATDVKRRVAAGRWLIHDMSAPDDALKLAPQAETIANQDLLLVRLDGLALSKNWQEVDTELTNNDVPLAKPMVYLYRARAARELGDPGKSQAFWERARSASSNDFGMLFKLAQYALELGAYDEAEKTLVALTHYPSQAQAAYTALLQVEAQHGTTADLIATLKQMTVDLPDAPEPKNDWAYLSLLSNQNVDEAWKTAVALVQAHPQMLAYRSTLALGFVRKNYLPGADKMYAGSKIDWSTSAPSWKMIYAVVLAAEGKKAEAAEFAKGIDRTRLRAEEVALLNSYVPAN